MHRDDLPVGDERNAHRVEPILDAAALVRLV